MSAVDESSQETKEQQQNGNEDVSSLKNLDVIAKRRKQNREAQRAYRERKAHRIQVLERSMGILQDMVTAWEKKYNDLKVQYDEQTVELNALKMRLQMGDRVSAISGSSNEDIDKDFEQSSNRSLSSLANFITKIHPPPTPTTVKLRSVEEPDSSNNFERIKKYMIGDKPLSVGASSGRSRESYQGSVLPSLMVSKPLHLRGHVKENSSECVLNKGNNNYSRLLYMLDSISKKTTAFSIPNQGKNNDVEGKDPSHSSSVTLQ